MRMVEYVCEKGICTCKDAPCTCDEEILKRKSGPCECTGPCTCNETACLCKEGPCTCKDLCDYTYEEIFKDTETQPQALPDETCKKCGANLIRGLNVKSNCQVWGVNKI